MSAPKKKPQAGDAEGSAEARRRASLVLEVLGGLRTPPEASELLKVTLPHYYKLEATAIQGLVQALEPRAKGGPRGPRLETQVARLTEERDRLQRELQRAQALARVAQRAFGLPSAEKQRTERNKRRKKQGKRHGHKPTVRARKAVERLKVEGDDPQGEADGAQSEKRRA